MKTKKIAGIVIVVVLVVLAVCAWLYGYHNRKSNDNLPALSALLQMEEAEINQRLQGYHSAQLVEVWGAPEEQGSNNYIWQIDAYRTLRVDTNWNDIVVACKIRDSGTFYEE